MATGTGKTRTFKADFLVVTLKGDRKNTVLKDLLAGATNGVTAAFEGEGNKNEKYQCREVVSIGGKGKVFMGVFGRCHFNEKPLQGKDTGEEEDVELKTGYGLVHKNHFVYHAGRNLLVYERSRSGSHHMRFQRYLNQAGEQGVGLEPILTTDAYARLINGPAVKYVDISFQQPKDISLYKGLVTNDAMKLVKSVGALNARLRFSVGRSPSRLVDGIKEAALIFARGGSARVARLKLEDDTDPIDLITDRIIETVTVPLQANGRAKPDDIYAALEQAATDREDDLKTFFGK